MLIGQQIKKAALAACSRTTNLLLDMREDPRAYAMNIAGGCWFIGSGILASAVGLGGTMYETVGGSIILVGEVATLTLGKKWFYAYNFSAACFVAGTATQRWPDLFSSHPYLAASTLALTAFNAPAILEFVAKDKAKTKLNEFRMAGRSLLSRAISETKRNFFRAFANPKTTTLDGNFVYSAVGLTEAIVKKHYYLVPVYLLWMAGNRIAKAHKPVPQPT